MSFAAYQEDSFSAGEVMRALEEIEGFWQNGEHRGVVDDEYSDHFGGYQYDIPGRVSLEDVITTLTDVLGYDIIERGDTVVLYRMDTVITLVNMGDAISFFIDHSPEGEYEDESMSEYEE